MMYSLFLINNYYKIIKIKTSFNHNLKILNILNIKNENGEHDCNPLKNYKIFHDFLYLIL